MNDYVRESCPNPEGRASADTSLQPDSCERRRANRFRLELEWGGSRIVERAAGRGYQSGRRRKNWLSIIAQVSFLAVGWGVGGGKMVGGVAQAAPILSGLTQFMSFRSRRRRNPYRGRLHAQFSGISRSFEPALSVVEWVAQNEI